MTVLRVLSSCQINNAAEVLRMLTWEVDPRWQIHITQDSPQGLCVHVLESLQPSMVFQNMQHVKLSPSYVLAEHIAWVQGLPSRRTPPGQIRRHSTACIP